MHDVSHEPRDTKGRWVSTPHFEPIRMGDLSTADARRSPEVSPEEFQQYAKRGKAKFNRLKGTPQPALALQNGPRWNKVVDDAYIASREPWGGVTVDSHTGEHVAPGADTYALTMKEPGQDSVHVSPNASKEEFAKAMEEARTRFGAQLRRPGYHLGVFHDDDLKRIDIDPVLVTPSLADVHDIGAYTRAVGGAYHFKSGDGFWPPHIKEKKKTMGKKKKTQEASLSVSYDTPTLHHAQTDLSNEGGRLAYWKQILPMKQIEFTAKDGSRQRLNFDAEYLTDLANNKAVDSVGFLLADVDNRHTMDPERWRGTVAEFKVRTDLPNPDHNGLWGKIVFPSVEAAKAVLDNPDLGVSARIRENIPRSDGSTVSRGIIHVLGTLDPQVSGMSPWQPTDLSTKHHEVLDLSHEEYEDMPEKKSTAAEEKFANVTEADIDTMDEKTLDEYLAFMGVTFAPYTGDTGGTEPTDETKTEDEKTLVGAGADMSTTTTTDLDLANQRAEMATQQAREAMRRVAEAEWRETRGAYMAEGVPAFALDLAAPVLNRADDMVIDLSSTFGEDDVNVSAVVRGLLDALKGSVDLSNEQGHFGTHSGEDNPDQAILDRWTI